MDWFGGAGGIRTLDRALQPYNGLANRRLQPLGHSSLKADMPDAGATCKRQFRCREANKNSEICWLDMGPVADAARAAINLTRRYGRFVPLLDAPLLIV